jgi:hypothetical protein
MKGEWGERMRNAEYRMRNDGGEDGDEKLSDLFPAVRRILYKIATFPLFRIRYSAFRIFFLNPGSG